MAAKKPSPSLARPASFEARTVSLTQRRLGLWWTFWTLFILAQLANILRQPLHLGFGFVIGGFAMMVASVGALQLWKDRRRGLLRVTADGISLDDRLVLARANLKQAYRYTRATAPVVRLVRARVAVPCDIELESESDAQALLVALKQDLGQATASFPTVVGGMRAQWRDLGLFVFLQLLIVGSLPWVMRPPSLGGVLAIAALSFLTSLGFWALLIARKGTVVVGADGVLLKRVARTSVFYPYGELSDVRVDGSDVLLSSAGKTARFGFIGVKKLGGQEVEVTRDAMLTRIEEARERFRTETSASDIGAMLAPGERDVSAWREAAERLLAGRVSFRTPAIPEDRVWAVLEDATQPEAARAGAAVALRIGLSDEGKGRLRVVRAASASAELGEALDAVGEDDEEKLEKALAVLGGERGKFR